jgi:antitoxin VapB
MMKDATRPLILQMIDITISTMKAKRAKLFMTGRSQAIRLPKEFRFKGDSVLIRREGATVILEPDDWPEGWGESFAGMPPDFARLPQGEVEKRDDLE